MESADISSEENCDYISRLPDPILHRILGLLDTREAVQTCVLSKRWKNLWTSLPSLKLVLYDDGEPEDTTASESFVKFVNTLLLRRKPLNLDVFHLSCDDICLEYLGQVSNWIHYAVNHNARVLHLRLCDFVPCCIYTCTSLEELYLYFISIDSFVQIVNLPNLRKLCICYMVLNSNYVKNLLSGCAILEFLSLNGCSLSSECVIVHDCLKHLSIDNSKKNDEFQLCISAPKLLSFFYKGRLSLPYKTTLNMPSLMSACLVSSDSSMNKCLEGMTTCLHFLTNVEHLEVHFDCNWYREFSAAILPLELPIFPKLKNMTVVICMFYCCQIVTWILKSSPNLKMLTIQQIGVYCYYCENGSDINESPNASSTIVISPCKKLEIVDVKCWEYNKMVRRLIDTLMDGTNELENLKIHLSKYKYEMQEVLYRLDGYPN